MGDFPKELFTKKEYQQELYNKLYDVVNNDEIRSDKSENYKEQWCLGIISSLRSNDDFKKINKLIELGYSADIINEMSHVLLYYRTHKSYVEHSMPKLLKEYNWLESL